jgi:hypothetical protein
MIVAIACLILPLQAGASPSRVNAMMLDQNTLWMIGLDEALFGFNPAILAELRPQVWMMETAPAGLPSGGIILNLLQNVNLYILTGLPMSFTDFAVIPAPALNANQEQLRIGASLAIGPLDIGATAMYTGMSQTNGTTGEKDTNTVIDLGGGVIIIINPATMNIDVSGDVKIWNIHREPAAGNVTYDTTTFDISALGRLNWEPIQNNSFHILGGFGMVDRSYTPGAGPRVKAVTTNINAGFSDEIQFSESITAFAGGLFAASIISNDTTDITAISADVVAGLEVAIIKEAIFRAGVTHRLFYSESDRAANTSSSTDTIPPIVAPYSTDFSCGLGIRIADLLIDMQVNRTFFLNGPYFVSGNPTTPFNASITVTYFLGPSKGRLK